jgi:hypothetical protein
MQRAQMCNVQMCRCADVQMQHGGGTTFICGLCAPDPLYSRVYHDIVLATCNWQQRASQQGKRVHILTRSSSLGANTAGALDLHRDMLYEYSSYICIFCLFLCSYFDSRHPAAAVGTRMYGRDPSARSASDKRHQRTGWGLFLAKYTT